MQTAGECEIKFEIVCKTQFGEQIYVVGNTPQLGFWVPQKGIALKTDADNYPNWYSENPLMLSKGAKFQFKFVRIALNSEQEWEEFPNNVNRKYRTRYQSVTLKAIWNDFSGREVSTKKYASSNIFSHHDIKVHKFKTSGVFIPYEKAGTSSGESDFDEQQQITNQPVKHPVTDPLSFQKMRFAQADQNNIFCASPKKNRNATQSNEQSQSGGESAKSQVQEDSDNFIAKPRKKLLRPEVQIQHEIQKQEESKEQEEQKEKNKRLNQIKLRNQDQLLPPSREKMNDSNSDKNQLSNKHISSKEDQTKKQEREGDSSFDKSNGSSSSSHQAFSFHKREKQLNSNNLNKLHSPQVSNLSSNQSKESIKAGAISQIMHKHHLNRIGADAHNWNDKEQQIVHYLNSQDNFKKQSCNNGEQMQQQVKLVEVKIDLATSGPEGTCEEESPHNIVNPNFQEESEGDYNLKKLQLQSIDNDRNFHKGTQNSIATTKETDQNLNQSYPQSNSIIGASKWKQSMNRENSNEMVEQNMSKGNLAMNKLIARSDVIFAEKLFQSSGHTLQQLFQEKQQKINEKNISKYSFITSENDIVFEASEEFLVNMSNKDELCISTFFLPVNVVYDPITDTIKDQLIETSLNYHFINSYPSLKWVGVLPNFPKIPQHLQEKVTTQLVQKYRFYPIFIEDELLDSFLNHFCANVYDDIMKNQFDLIHSKQLEFNSKIAEEVKMVSFRFAQQMYCMIDDDTNIMVADYRIIFAIVYLCQVRGKKLNISYFHDHQFPDFDKLQLLPFGEQLINAILCSNLVSFTTFEAAHNFLNYVRLKLKLPFESVRGNLRLIYMGNQIIIHIRSAGVNAKMIAAIKHSNAFEEQVNKIKSTQINKDSSLVIIGIDTLSESSKLVLKLRLFHKLLQNYPLMKAQLIQIILPDPYDYSKGKSGYGNLDLISDINKAANEIQKNFKESNALQIIYSNMSLRERVAYLSLGHLFLKTSIQSESEVYAQEFTLSSDKSGFALLNKFGSQQYKQIRSFVTFNPHSYYEFEKNLLQITDLSTALKEKVLLKDIDLLNQFSTGIWIEKTIAQLKKNAKFMSQANMTGFNKGINFKKVAHQANFRQFNVHEAAHLYQKTAKRIIILGYVGTLVPFDKYMYIQAEEHQVRRHHQKPSQKIIEDLKNLCADKRNMVYIVTELSIDFMDEWFGDVKGIGLICENGYLHKVVQENDKSNNEWVRLIELDLSWKSLVYRIMESYAIRSQGSSVEVKESSVVWKYNKVSIDFGSRQAKEMVEQLKQVLSPLKYLEVFHQGESVEVRASNLNKGIVVELLIEKKILECGGVDFVLILGSSTSDEDMFCACQMTFRNRKMQDVRLKPLYVTIGVKPSNAHYYVAFEDVEKILELLKVPESFLPYS